MVFTLLRHPKAPPMQRNHLLMPAAVVWGKPSPGTSWQWQLGDEIDPPLDIQMYDEGYLNGSGFPVSYADQLS